MSYLSLAWTGLWRKPVRFVLTFLSVVVAFLLFGMLEGLSSGFAKAIADSHLDRLITDPRVPGGAFLPIAKKAEIQNIEGVMHVAERASFIGFYQQPRNAVAVLATDPKSWFAVRPEFRIDAKQFDALAKTRTALIATPALQRLYGWRIGDRIPLKSRVLTRDGSDVWTFDFVGTFDIENNPTQAHLAVINYDYLNQARVRDQDTADRFLIRIADPARSAEVSAAIDRLFANSPYETRTRSEREQAQARTKQLGDIAFLTNSIVGAVFFTLLFVTANTVIQSVRERTAEFGVLKTIGFSDLQLTLLVVLEAAVLCLAAALLGLALSAASAPLLVRTLGPVSVSVSVVGTGIIAAILLSVASAGLPAWRAGRLRIVEALATR